MYIGRELIIVCLNKKKSYLKAFIHFQLLRFMTDSLVEALIDVGRRVRRWPLRIETKYCFESNPQIKFYKIVNYALRVRGHIEIFSKVVILKSNKAENQVNFELFSNFRIILSHHRR